MGCACKWFPPRSIVETITILDGVVAAWTGSEGELEPWTGPSVGQWNELQGDAAGFGNDPKIGIGIRVNSARQWRVTTERSDNEIVIERRDAGTGTDLESGLAGSQAGDWNGHKFDRIVHTGTRQIQERI